MWPKALATSTEVTVQFELEMYLRTRKGGGGSEDSYSAWHFFCVRIIQQKVTSYPVEN